MTKNELYRQYKEALAQLEQQAHEARERVRVTFKEQLKAIRKEAHKELKAIRALEQETRRNR